MSPLAEDVWYIEQYPRMSLEYMEPLHFLFEYFTDIFQISHPSFLFLHLPASYKL